MKDAFGDSLKPGGRSEVIAQVLGRTRTNNYRAPFVPVGGRLLVTSAPPSPPSPPAPKRRRQRRRSSSSPSPDSPHRAHHSPDLKATAGPSSLRGLAAPSQRRERPPARGAESPPRRTVSFVAEALAKPPGNVQGNCKRSQYPDGSEHVRSSADTATPEEDGWECGPGFGFGRLLR